MTLDNAVTTPRTKITTVEEGIALAKLFEAAGADSMHLRLGPLGHHVAQFGSDLYFILNGIEGASGFGTPYALKKHWQGQLIGDTQGAGMPVSYTHLNRIEIQQIGIGKNQTLLMRVEGEFDQF